MSTDTKIKTLICNKLTQEQYNNADRVPTEFYLTPDTSIDSSEKGAANGVASLDTNGKVPSEQIQVATTSTLGVVKPDGTTITVTEDGTISVPVSAQLATKAELQSVDSSKANTDLSNVLANIDYVVDRKVPTADDPTWYRKYKSGWVEQGGVIPAVVGNITFLKPFANTNYTVVGNISLTYRRAGQGDNSGSILFFPEATSFCYVTWAARNFGDIGQQNISWMAEGQGAQ